MRKLLGLTAMLMLAYTPPFPLPLFAAMQEDDEQEEDSRAQRAFATLSFSLGGTGYNRVEGLPFMVGPVARSDGPNPFRGQGFLILRSAPVTGLDQVAYLVQGEKLFGGPQRIILGAGFHSEVRAIEDRGLSNIDNSLSAFVFHDDYRDYHNRQGLYVFAAYDPTRGPLSAAVEFRTERHDVLGRGRPGSIFENNTPWRFQPMIAEGKIHSVSLGGRFDNRPSPRPRPRPRRGQAYGQRAGWVIEAEIMKALGGRDLVFPTVSVTADDRPLGGIPTIDPSFAIGGIDVRRYTPIANLNLNLRFTAGGALTTRALPPQFQHALGGRGTLPGLTAPAESPDAPVPAMDCGARTSVLVSRDLLIGSPRLYPFYGCDRYVLFQAQLEGYFGFRIGDEDIAFGGPPLDFTVELVPRWIAFLDAAQAWVLGSPGPFPRGDEDLQFDAGGGVAFGDLGFFVAVPLQGDDRDPKLVVRLGSRF